MTDRYSKMSPFLQELDRVTSPPDDGSAPIDHLIAAGVPGVGDIRSWYKSGRDLVKAARDELGYGPSAQPHDGRGVPGKVPNYNPKTGKTTLVPDSPLPDVGFRPSEYDPQGGRNIVLPRMVSPEYGGRLGLPDENDQNVTIVPETAVRGDGGPRAAAGGRYAIGGNPSAFVERAASYGLRHEGFLNSGIAGRTDHIGLQVRNGSYVIPADVVSAAGQGNSLAGAKAFDSLLKQGPYGTSFGNMRMASSRPMMPSMRMGNTMRMPNNMGRSLGPGAGSGSSPFNPNMFGKADGGPVKKPRELVAPPGNWKGLSAGGVSRPGGDHTIPILAAGGEYIVSPETVARIGAGDQQKGFRILDKLVLMTRRKHINTLKNLKPPKKK